MIYLELLPEQKVKVKLLIIRKPDELYYISIEPTPLKIAWASTTINGWPNFDD